VYYVYVINEEQNSTVALSPTEFFVLAARTWRTGVCRFPRNQEAVELPERMRMD
jgi:hypothetical protein